MTEKRKTPKAAGLQRKKRAGKLDKAHTLTGLERSAFENAWLSLPEGVRRKCSAAELAQLVSLFYGEVCEKAREEMPAKSVRSPGNALQSFQNRFRRAFASLPAFPPVRDYVPALRGALTGLAVRMPWGKK